jgi:mono/diheme cytochrome c family protein
MAACENILCLLAPRFRRDLDPKGVFQSIADGREKSGLRMPAWREVLTDEEIWKATA